MSEFGLFVKGANNNLIIDGDNPVLAKLYRGAVTMTGPSVQYLSWESIRRGKYYYGYSTAQWRTCDVVYPAPVTSIEPPLVMATPNLSAQGFMLGRFSHHGVPGWWTGFSVTAACPGAGYYPISTAYGAPTGWDWVVCSFAAPPSNQPYGLRVWGEHSQLIFDSGWSIVPFRQLMLGWSFAAVVSTGGITRFVDSSDLRITYGASTMYGANSYANTNVQINDYVHYYSHPWGHVDGTIGVLISSIGSIPVAVDNGYTSYYVFYTTPFIGFGGADRSSISMFVPLGWAQHAGAYPQTFNSFSLMTADVSRA